MDQALKTAHEKLKRIRERTDLSLRSNRYLRDSITALDGTERPFTLRYYQVQMVLHLLVMNNFVVGDDTGLGKTIETIAALTYIWDRQPEGQKQKVIILAKKSAVPQWSKEFARFSDGVEIILCKGTPNQREKAFNAFDASNDKPTVIIMGYRSAVVDFKRHLQPRSGYILVADEVHVCKNPKTQVHKVCRYMGERASRIWGLSATIIKNNLVEGYGVYRVVMPRLFTMSKSRFEAMYCITRMQRIGKGRQVPMVVGYHKHQIIKFRDDIDPFFLGRPKHKVASELPVLTTRVIETGMTNFQWKKYKETLAGLLLMGTGKEAGDGEMKEVSPLTALIYCQEIVNHPYLIDYEDEPSAKLKALKELLTEGEFEGEKVIVFTRFERMVTKAIEHLNKHGVKSVRVTGKESEDERAEAQEAFQDLKSDVQVVWITMAGGDSINLQAAKALVFFDTPWSAGDYIQILGRMIRIGSIHDRCYALHLIAKGTVDERVMQVMKKKLKLVEAIIGKRILGEDDEVVKFDATSDLNAIYDALLDDAREQTEG
jgi:SNF2 family DNA or RNA helicase